MNKLIIGLIVIFVIVGGVFLFTRQGTAPAAPTDTTNTSTATTSDNSIDLNVGATLGTVKAFTVTGSNFSFDTKEIRVNKGDTVQITFKNANGTHDWVIDQFHASTKVIKGGEQETISFVADTAGTFEYYCSVGQHRANGMKGNLIVQ